MSRGKRERSSSMNVSKQAREALGITLKRFASLIGRSPSIVWRREGDPKVSLTPTAATLCNTIIEAVIATIPAEEIIDAMEAVPEDERSEQAANNALVVLCINRGKLKVVNRAMGAEVEPPPPLEDSEEEEEATMAQRLRVMTNMMRDFESLGKKFSGPEGEYYRGAAADMARALYQAEQGIRAVKDRRQVPGDEEPE